METPTKEQLKERFEDLLKIAGKESMSSDPEMLEIMQMAFDSRNIEVNDLKCEVDRLELLVQTVGEQMNTFLAEQK